MWRRYKDLKGKGAVSLSKAGDIIVMTVKNFDPNTGKPKPDTTHEVHMEELEREKTRFIEEKISIDDRAVEEKERQDKDMAQIDELLLDAGK